MTINPFRRSVISKMKTDSFKGKLREKKDLAESAGIHGFSRREMEEKLRKTGYDMKKRTNIMGQISKKKPEGLTEQQKERNIRWNRTESRIASDGETARVAGHGSFAGGKVETKSMKTMEGSGIGKTPGRFGLSGSSSNQGMASPPATIGNLGSKRFL